MPKFEIGIKKVSYGHQIVYAKDKDEAKQKAELGEITENVLYQGEDTIQMDCKQRKSDE